MAKSIRDAKQLLKEICSKAIPYDHLIMQSVEGEKDHALAVLNWVLVQNPKASLALRLAALFHDVDRLVNPTKGGGFKGKRNSKAYIRHKRNHARRSAEFIAPRLRECGFEDDVVKRTVFLITHHDDPGLKIEDIHDCELHQLVAADTFAFFTSIAPKLYEAEGKERTRDKIRFMVDKLPDSSRQLLWEYPLAMKGFESLKNDVIKEYYLKNSIREKAYKYCPSCRRRLRYQRHVRHQFLECIHCGFVYWNPPSPVTSVIVQRKDSVLMLRRAQAPLRGFWCLPGGYIRYEETPEVAAVREFKEETGLDVQLDRLIGVYQIDTDPRGVNIDIIWLGTVLGGVITGDKESDKIQWFKTSNLPERIAYKHREAIADARFGRKS